ncbi:MAG: glycoside hydrolase family 15 protein [Candidatus Binatia bacterium]
MALAALQSEPHSYPPIRDYAVIGDCHGASLVSRQGSVDWCCLRRFDAAPIFWRILDATKGGFLSVCPEGDYTVERTYLPGTNILCTTFSTSSGKLKVTDFMPVGRSSKAGVHDYVTLNAPGWLVRIVEGVAGSMRIGIRYRPTMNFARRDTRLVVSRGCIATENRPWLYSDIEFAIHDDLAEGSIEIRAGERHHLVIAATPIEDTSLPASVDRLFAITRAFWQEWSAYCRYEGPYRESVLRSALALKLLTYAPSGAMIAAPTTSLPEEIGSERNWDYRYSWPRDASFTLYALAAIGYSGEARRFGEFLMRSCMTARSRLQVMYGINGETELTEHTLDHLDGYSGSRPVRTGNGAFAQQQLDVYGEVLDWAFLHQSLGGRFDRSAQKFFEALAEFVAAHWQKPDHGIWEARGEPRQYVLGKIMGWVALDRATRMFGDDKGRSQAQAQILRTVREQGVDAENGALVQTFDESQIDAALLLTPMLGFPIERDVLKRTVQAVEHTLQRGDYVLRHLPDDSLPGEEGAFLCCSFWLVDALLILDREREAHALYERLLACANDVGLYAEEIDPTTHAFLGNFPQALTHLALIQNAAHLAIYEQHGVAALQGTNADRARYGVEATAGWRGLWAAFKKSGRVGRLRSSRASMLP